MAASKNQSRTPSRAQDRLHGNVNNSTNADTDCTSEEDASEPGSGNTSPVTSDRENSPSLAQIGGDILRTPESDRCVCVYMCDSLQDVWSFVCARARVYSIISAVAYLLLHSFSLLSFSSSFLHVCLLLSTSQFILTTSSISSAAMSTTGSRLSLVPTKRSSPSL